MSLIILVFFSFLFLLAILRPSISLNLFFIFMILILVHSHNTFPSLVRIVPGPASCPSNGCRSAEFSVWSPDLIAKKVFVAQSLASQTYSYAEAWLNISLPKFSHHHTTLCTFISEFSRSCTLPFQLDTFSLSLVQQ